MKWMLIKVKNKNNSDTRITPSNIDVVNIFNLYNKNSKNDPRKLSTELNSAAADKHGNVSSLPLLWQKVGRRSSIAAVLQLLPVHRKQNNYEPAMSLFVCGPE